MEETATGVESGCLCGEEVGRMQPGEELCFCSKSLIEHVFYYYFQYFIVLIFVFYYLSTLLH